MLGSLQRMKKRKKVAFLFYPDTSLAEEINNEWHISCLVDHHLPNGRVIGTERNTLISLSSSTGINPLLSRSSLTWTSRWY